MKKYAIIMLILLAGCSENVQQASPKVSLEKVAGFEDCTYARVYPGNGLQSVIAIRCPNSSTSVGYQEGKARYTSVVIDGIKYIREDNK